MGYHRQSIDYKVISRIYGRKRGNVFTPNDFLELGSRKAVDMALSRLVKAGTVRRLSRGVYDYPNTHPQLGVLTPDPETIAMAIAGKNRIRLQPHGAYAANLLGLSEQVPAKVTFLTDGLTRTIKVGRQVIELRRTSPRNMATAGELTGLVIQAFRYLGAKHITPERIAHLRRTIPQTEREKLLKAIPVAPGWMHPHLRALAREET